MGPVAVQAVKAVSLFTGIGGMDLAFERAGVETVLQAERDPHCIKVLERHWPHTRRVTDVRCVGVYDEGDRCREGQREQGDNAIGAVPGAAERDGGEREHAAPRIDLVYGGFPCQDLSVAGKRAGLGGERSGLWFEFHRVLRELRPRWAVIENVPGLLSSNDGRDFGVILDGLDELGFDVAWAILDAQHFGVPQRRRRVFIVAGPGRRAVEQVFALCESCGGHPETGRAEGERLADSLTVGANQYSGFPGEPVEIATTVTSRYSWKQSPRGDGSDNLVVANTLKANTGHAHGFDLETYIPETAYAIAAREAKGVSLLESQTNYIARGGVRRLTPLECERLQGFPDGWTDGLADSHRYKQMGNAVCVPVAEWIGHRLVAVDAEVRQSSET